MRKAPFLLLALLIAAPAAAQNTDIESLSGLQFNFGNPGARSLGMGGAFLGLADDASAAEANPAGLTILRKPEVTVELRNYKEAQLLSTSGVYPDIERTGFQHYSDRAVVSFASVVMSIKNFALSAYYHQPLRNAGAGAVLPVRNEFSGRLEKDVPSFYLPRGGGAPLTEDECDALRNSTRDIFACVEFGIKPFVTTLDIDQRTYGVAGAWKIHEKFSIGLAVRMQEFREEALTVRFDDDFNFDSFTVQTTGGVSGGDVDLKAQRDVTFSGGFKWTMNDKFSVGGVYKQGGQFDAPIFGANADTRFEFVHVADTKFHTPDVGGLGVSFRPIPVLTVNVDAVHVKYSNLVDDVVSFFSDVQDLAEPYKAEDVTELHIGAEYFFPTKIPMALRVGYWRDPAHSVEYQGPVTTQGGVAAAILYPKGESQNHLSIGGGLAWPRFQIDLAYDTADNYKVGSISMVTRF